tara:strand:- start:122 stop:1075 length:954 start_codon:yes stop_codon:yes gene_type:complete
MKKFIKNILKYFLLSISFYIPLLIIYGEYFNINLKSNLHKRAVYGNLFDRNNDIENFSNVDILFLGDSHVYRGFDNRIFLEKKLKTFNLASSGQTPKQTEILIKRHIDQLNPKLVIINANPNSFCVNGIESTYDLIINTKIDSMLIRSVFHYKNWRLLNTLIFNFFKKNIKKNFNVESITDYEKKYFKDNKYISGGFVERKLSFNTPQNYPSLELLYLEEQFDAFNNIVNLIRKKDINFLITQIPVTQAYYNRVNNIKIFNNKMRDIGEYINFNNIVDLNDSLHFYDSNHLNKNGVEVFNHFFIKDIINKKKLHFNN